jgi:glucose/arabinose dehydrogenase
MARDIRGALTLAVAGLAVALAAIAAPALAPGGEQSGSDARSPSARIGDGRGGFAAETVANFDQPVYVNGPAGANGLVFVVEQPGTIRMIKDGKKLGGAFLDIRDRVQSGGERGLLSVAFSPFYANNRRFYVFYTDQRGDLVVQEYRTSRNDPRDAKEASARTVIKVRHRENSNHNGGQLQFGPDGDLYISTGDGGSGGDPPENAQNKSKLLGKILRIDPGKPNGTGKKGYTVPRSNPFVGRAGADEIFSYGLRNPYRFSFDRRRIAIGDVGQDSREEIDFEKLGTANGANFGWDAFEGNIRFPSSDASPPPPKHERPILDYSHSRGCAVAGGYVVRDKRIASLSGRYIYADYCQGEIRTLIPRTDRARDDRSAGLPNESGISSFGEDTRGRIWFANVNDGSVSVIKPR